MIARPEYIAKINPFVGKPIVKVFTGLRRSGKSCLLALFREELIQRGVAGSSILTFNLESRQLPFLLNIDSIYAYLQSIIGKLSGKVYVLLDEIQEVPSWEKLINSLLIDFNVDIYLTGSNAHLLSSELSTYLSGRYVEISVFPLSFRELRGWYEKQGFDHKRAFKHYLRYGGMPFIYDSGLNDSACIGYLQDVYASVMLKDIVTRHGVRDSALLEKFISFIIGETGHLFSAQSVVKYLKSQHRQISTETLYNYVKYCEESCLLLPVPRFDVKGKALLATQGKVYIADHGFRQMLFGNNEASIEQVLENIVAVELLRRGWKISVGVGEKNEIDFVATRNKETHYFQVTYLMPSRETAEREFQALLSVKDNFPKTVLSLDEFDFSRDGIEHKNLINFLFQE